MPQCSTDINVIGVINSLVLTSPSLVRLTTQTGLACIVNVFLCGLGAKNYRAINGTSKRGGRGRKEERIPFPNPRLSFLWLSRPIFCAGKMPKIPFLHLSLFPNPTEAKTGPPKRTQTNQNIN